MHGKVYLTYTLDKRSKEKNMHFRRLSSDRNHPSNIVHQKENHSDETHNYIDGKKDIFDEFLFLYFLHLTYLVTTERSSSLFHETKSLM
jgi:hypothetical protein